MFGIEIEEGPIIGLVDLSDHEGVWLDMNQLNLSETKKHKESNLEVLQAWIDQVMDGTISVEEEKKPPAKPAVPESKGKKKKEL